MVAIFSALEKRKGSSEGPTVAMEFLLILISSNFLVHEIVNMSMPQSSIASRCMFEVMFIRFISFVLIGFRM
jgi:hypothetical protein